MRLLVDTPSGKQEVIEVGDGGGYFDPDRVLWDERVDGELPGVTLGGMVRVGGSLVFDQARMDEHLAAAGPSTGEMIKHYDGLVQGRLDGIARDRFRYGDPNRPEVSPILHAISYAEEPAVVKFQAEGRLLRAWRSRTWVESAAILEAVENGRPVPSEGELLTELETLAPAPTVADVEAEITRLTAA